MSQLKAVMIGLAIAAGIMVIVACGISTLTSIGNNPRNPSPAGERVPAASTLTPIKTQSPAAASASPKPTLYATIGEGIWTVGVDIAPGTYKVNDVVSDCYWSIYKSGTNGKEIIANDIVRGGRPTVVLERGQDFRTQHCGTWVKAG